MINNTAHTKQKGFTLVELLLVVALTSIAVGVTSDVLVSLVRGFNKSQVINEIEQNANFISQKLNKELRNASEIIYLGGVTPTQEGTGDSITIIDRDGTRIDYVVSDGVMTRSRALDDFAPLTHNTLPTGVTVTCPTACFTLLEDSPQVVQISLLIEQAGTPSTVVFKGDISIEDTIVIRDTY